MMDSHQWISWIFSWNQSFLGINTAPVMRVSKPLQITLYLSAQFGLGQELDSPTQKGFPHFLFILKQKGTTQKEILGLKCKALCELHVS